jgi:hypothetical protein
MSGGAIIAVIVIVVIVAAAAIAAAVYSIRQRELRRRFGPEYDRLVTEYQSKRKAAAELTRRERRVRDLEITELDPAARDRYMQEWAAVQELFVDTPQRAVAEAQRLVMTVMNERGYPTDQPDQILADLSVDHASVLDHYRVASAISERAASGTASTEDLRQALINYRTLFGELLGEPMEPAAAAGEGEAERSGTEAREASASEPETGFPVPPEETSPVARDDTVVPATLDDTVVPGSVDDADGAPAAGTAPDVAADTDDAPSTDAVPAAPEAATPPAEAEETTAAEDEARPNGVARQGARTVRE